MKCIGYENALSYFDKPLFMMSSHNDIDKFVGEVCAVAGSSLNPWNRSFIGVWRVDSSKARVISPSHGLSNPSFQA